MYTDLHWYIYNIGSIGLKFSGDLVICHAPNLSSIALENVPDKEFNSLIKLWFNSLIKLSISNTGVNMSHTWPVGTEY